MVFVGSGSSSDPAQLLIQIQGNGSDSKGPDPQHLSVGPYTIYSSTISKATWNVIVVGVQGGVQPPADQGHGAEAAGQQWDSLVLVRYGLQRGLRGGGQPRAAGCQVCV